MSVDEAARVVLTSRLQTVLHHLPLASTEADKDVEHVHQLRVSTRRAGAALRLFADCLPEKRFVRLNKLLRSIRRAAGAARDWDVFRQLLDELRVSPARDLLRGVIAARRCDAQLKLVEIVTTKGEDFSLEVVEMVEERFNWKEPDEPRIVGKRAISHLTTLMQELADRAMPPPTVYVDLHQFRILGKRLRYSMEIFAGCFTELFREELYPAIEAMQEILGHVTDAHVAGERIREIRDHLKAFHRVDFPRYQKPIEELLGVQRRIFPGERKRFMAWLPEWKKLTNKLKLPLLLRENL
ncbi:MAG: CHAD domain-containing protein [Planctomycetes bacterium]|nr:CHAD domain-containing protein [Planctomycetota bacterium]